jgi:carbamoyl-phosphate synthase large subunit
VLKAAGIPCEQIDMVSEPRTNVADAIEQGRIAFMINTPGGHRSRGDGFRIRAMAVNHGIDLVTAMSGATALIQAIAALRTGSLEPYALQDLV